MPHEKTSDELLAEGDAYYQDRQYQRAKTAYLAAFESSHDSNDVTPLDKAASCYLRLKDYNSALALAKKMSKLNAGDVRVYLRMGQTLQLLQKSALATKIYAKGLQRCRVTAEGYDTLRKQYNMLESQERATKSEDPVNVIPYEMLDQIMGYLDFKCRVNLLRVSKKWRSYLISNSCLWRDLDLSLTRRPVSRNCIANYIKWSDGRMHTARLKRLAKFQSLWELGRQCQITSLCWMGSDFTLASITHPLMAFKNLQSLTVTCEFVTLDSVQVILRQVPSLISLEFHYLHDVKQHLFWDFDLPNLQHLKINCAKKFNNDWFLKLCPQQLVKRIPNIRTLALTNFIYGIEDVDFSGLVHLETLDLGGTFFGLLTPKLPGDLRSLHLSGRNSAFRPEIPQAFPKLESFALDVNVPPGAPGHYIQFPNTEPFLLPLLQYPMKGGLFEPGSPPLRRLAIKPSPSGLWWKEILATPRLERLEDIDMGDLRDEHEDFICKLVTDHLPYLKRLNIGGFYRLTGWGIKQLVTGLPHLEELVLSGCPKVHYDAIEWARKKLKRVDWTPVQEARSGRRVLWG
ncbi:hypothetical protein HDK64DRAFT_300488 [Phyllosticta capitalensis]